MRCGECCLRRRRGCALPKILNVVAHPELNAPHAETFRFGERVVAGPSFSCHAMDSDDHPGAIDSIFAMDQNASTFRRVDDLQNTGDSRFLGSRPVWQCDVVVIQSERANFLLFRSRAITRPTQVDDGVNPKFANSIESSCAWLTAAKQSFVHLLKSW